VCGVSKVFTIDRKKINLHPKITHLPINGELLSRKDPTILNLNPLKGH
jgi:hypothetical protein